MNTITQQLEELLKHPANRERFLDHYERSMRLRFGETSANIHIGFMLEAITYVEKHNTTEFNTPSTLIVKIRTACKQDTKKAAAEETVINILNNFTEAEVHNRAPKAIVNRLEEIVTALLT